MYTAKVLTQDTETGQQIPVEFQSEDPSLLIEVLWYEEHPELGIQEFTPNTKLLSTALFDVEGNLIPPKDWMTLYQTHRHLHKESSS